MILFIDSNCTMWPEPVSRYTPSPPWTLEAVSEPTQTATQDIASLRKAPPLGLVIVHHPKPEFVGASAPLPKTGPLILGREGSGFSPESMEDGRVS